MTNLDDKNPQNPHHEAQLSSLYQARKEQHRATASMKRQAMAGLAPKQSWTGFVQRSQQVAIAAGMLLLVSLLALQSHQFEQSHSGVEYTSVAIHSLNEQTEQDYAQLRELFDQHTSEFKQRSALLASLHKKAAVLSQFDDGWQLKTCDQELVKISEELVVMLKEMNLIDGSIKNGDSVQIAFNEAGLIIGIESSQTLLQCT